MKITAEKLEQEFRAQFCLAVEQDVETQDRLRLMIKAMQNQVEVFPEHGECPVCGRAARPDARYCYRCGRKFKPNNPYRQLTEEDKT